MKPILLAAALAALPALGAAGLAACADEPEPTCRDRGDCELGAPCSRHRHCESDLCLAWDDPAGDPDAEPATVCVQPCDDEDTCAAAQSCRLAPVERADPEDEEVVTRALEAACLPSLAAGGLLGDVCAGDAECRAGLCHAQRCSELCGACGPGAVCETEPLRRFALDAAVGVCRWSLAAPALTFAAVEVDAESGSAPIVFEVPDGLASFTIVVHHAVEDYRQRAGVRALIAPDGTVLADSEDDVADVNPPSIRYPGASAMLVPATDAPSARPRPGTYALRVGLWETDFVTWTPLAATLDEVTVTFERAEEEGGQLDLALFLAPGTGLDAASAAGDAYLTEALETAAALYRRDADLAIRVLGYEDIDAAYDDAPTGDVIRDICARHAAPGPYRTAVDVVLVADIAFTSGFTGGSPSPPGVHGTPASCIVIDAAADAAETGIVLAHELGHFLGLKHTTSLEYDDASGGYDIAGEDPIGDTPTCGSGQALHQCADYHNLMFPLFPLEDLSLTPAQVDVIRGNPALYELDRPRLCAVAPATWDVSDGGAATSRTDGLTHRMTGSCGGAAAPDRLHVYRLAEAGLAALEVTAVGRDFAPAVYVRQGTCDAEAPEVACATGAAGEAVVARVDAPPPGPYFIVVDGAEPDAGGRFTLRVAEVPGG